jgi:hypothetical protein
MLMAAGTASISNNVFFIGLLNHLSILLSKDTVFIYPESITESQQIKRKKNSPKVSIVGFLAIAGPAGQHEYETPNISVTK